MASKSKLEDLNLSQDEMKRLGEALKDEKFRNLLVEYAEEISDPENRRRYEEDIAQMERERGMDVVFIRPEPGYVLKTSVDGDKKAFINISKSDKIDKPSAERQTNADGKSGLLWHIPHSFAPPRQDHDKQNKSCQVYDFIVHPDTYRMAEKNARFQKIVEDTAMDGIEKQFAVTVDRKNVTRPKMQFKGIPTATVKRDRNPGGPQPAPDASDVLKDMPYPYDSKTTEEKMKEREGFVRENEKKNRKDPATNKSGGSENKDDATVPKYTIVHRSEVDMQEYRNAPDAKPSTRPCELVIKIELPLLKSASQANLDIFEKRLLLESSMPATYKLDLSLPYPVDEANGSAKFDKQKRTLLVTLPVIPDKSPSLPSFVDGGEIQTEEEEHSIDKPLIEVLSDSRNDELSFPEENGKLSSDRILVTKGINHHINAANIDEKTYTPAVIYTLPEYTFTQDTETISYVLKVKNVVEDSVKRITCSSNEMFLSCTSLGDGGFLLHFSIFLRFADSCKIAPEYCSVDITSDNVVLLLLKERQCRGLWDKFWVGKDSSSVEEHLFLTTSNLQHQLMELDNAAAAAATEQTDLTSVSGTDCSSCNLEVTAMNEKKLTIKISQPKSKWSRRFEKEEEEEADEYDPPSSAEIQVVHTQPSPNLHGILKQRTVSESSEDFTLESESPRSPIDDEDELSSSFGSGKRRSVSFSKHIDKATFKSSASVNSMKTALKSKRKRQRKWEEKNDKASSRRRHNSAGSEGSGDDHCHSLSDSHSHSEEEVLDAESQGDVDEEDRKLKTRMDVRTKHLESTTLFSECFDSSEGSTPSIEAVDSSKGSAASSKSLGSVACEEGGLTQKDSGFIGESGKDVKEGKKDDESLKDPGSMDQRGNTGADKLRDPGSIQPAEKQGSSTELHPESTSNQGSKKKDRNIADKIKSKVAEGTSEIRPEDSDDEDEEEVNDSGFSQGAGHADSAIHNEHRTECAFAFSNEVMFDLDIE